ncbi:hypothetical protein VTJ83DRAFT_2774 [Remersonia thermophila]|uniref:Cytochrome P450 n=1 Tax=Remersonia thermophila TaxID=72144 RepID=A0ABR4DJN7_9PEZI
MIAKMLLLVVAAYVFAAAIRYLYRLYRLPKGARFLPGPVGIPFIGRIHDLPAKCMWVKLHEWSKTYGPIYQTEIFGTTHVWITSEKVAADVLSKKASIYSDRPLIPNLPDNRTSGDYLALLGRTDTWHRQRKLCSHLMHVSASASLHSYPTLERDRFLYLMARDPASYVEWIEQFTSRTVSWLSWGTPRPAQILRHTTFGLLETISPSGALPNVIGALRHLPAWLSPWQQKERKRHEMEDRLFRANAEYVARDAEKRRGAPSFLRTYVEEKLARQGAEQAGTQEIRDGVGGGGGGATVSARKEVGDLDEARHVVGLMAIAGALTIGSPIQSFLLAMCHYPEWQRKLQEELDGVLGGRCPEWEDREKLPLLRAVVKEVIRWRPPVPTGATIHPLEWGITRDETLYPDPETFNPARWLDPSYPTTYREPLTRYPNLSGFSQFGFGRRTCQGTPVVEQDLMLTMGGLAWAFHIRKKRDPATGKEIPVHWNDFTPLLIAKPAPFQFDVVARSEERMKAVRQRYTAAVHAYEKAQRAKPMDIAKFEGDLGERIYGDEKAHADALVPGEGVRVDVESGEALQSGKGDNGDEAMDGMLLPSEKLHDMEHRPVAATTAAVTAEEEGNNIWLRASGPDQAGRREL